MAMRRPRPPRLRRTIRLKALALEERRVGAIVKLAMGPPYRVVAINLHANTVKLEKLEDA